VGSYSDVHCERTSRNVMEDFPHPPSPQMVMDIGIGGCPGAAIACKYRVVYLLILSRGIRSFGAEVCQSIFSVAKVTRVVELVGYKLEEKEAAEGDAEARMVALVSLPGDRFRPHDKERVTGREGGRAERDEKKK
jgi:hypothetical protein